VFSSRPRNLFVFMLVFMLRSFLVQIRVVLLRCGFVSPRRCARCAQVAELHASDMVAEAYVMPAADSHHVGEVLGLEQFGLRPAAVASQALHRWGFGADHGATVRSLARSAPLMIFRLCRSAAFIAAS